MDTISLRYAKALFDISLEKDNVISSLNEVKTIIELLNENPKYINVLSSSFISKEEKIEMIEEAFKSVNKDIKGLINIAIQNGRASIILDIFKEYVSLCNEYQNVKEGFVYSVIPLTKKEINEIENVISKKENTKVELINRIDASLIGGVKVVVKDKVYDGSILAKINSLKENLIKGGKINEN